MTLHLVDTPFDVTAYAINVTTGEQYAKTFKAHTIGAARRTFLNEIARYGSGETIKLAVKVGIHEHNEIDRVLRYHHDIRIYNV